MHSNHAPTRRRQLLCALGALSLGSLLPASARAQAVNFGGETIAFVTPFGVGGGTDAWARFNAPFFSAHLPGRPVVVVRNVPGGGSVTGANQFARTARPDGLSVLGTSASTQFPFLLGDPRVRYDYANWRVVMAAPTGGVAYIAANLGVRSAADLGQIKGTRLIFASQGATSMDLVPLLGFRLLGLDVRHVFGMGSRGEGRLAFERGEANIDHQTSSAYLRHSLPLVAAGRAVPLFSWGVTDDAGRLIRDPAFADLPHIGEAIQLATGKAPTGLEWEAFRAFLIAGFQAQKMVVLPRATPEPIVQAWRGAVRAMRNDPAYKAGLDSALGGYEQVTDQAAEELFTAATTITPAARDWVRELLATNYNVRF
jgi:tripartite-type tricarboxylate transporter receptor subunit TctC